MTTFLKRKKNLNMLAFSIICIASMATNNAYGMYGETYGEEGGGSFYPRLSSTLPTSEEVSEIQGKGGFEYGGTTFIAEEPLYPSFAPVGSAVLEFDPATSTMQLVNRTFENKYDLVPASGYEETDVYIPGQGGFRKAYTGEAEEKKEVLGTFRAQTRGW
ncbi:MAG: hypothetical protein K2X28_03380 [Alphaproteobacteria bacterium]|nr:hypothetical protein [Alphaproteobacteria bacterium]